MDEESAPIKQIQETEGMIASTLSRCEKIVDYELMELMRRKTDRSTETMPKSVVSRVEEKLLSLCRPSILPLNTCIYPMGVTLTHRSHITPLGPF